MSGTTAPVGGAGGGMDTATLQADMVAAQAQQLQMFDMSIKENEKNTEISTWGNLAEGIAKNKPQV